MQERRNPIANALESHISCTNPSACSDNKNNDGNVNGDINASIKP